MEQQESDYFSMRVTSQAAGVVARVLARVHRDSARKFGFWYRLKTLMYPRWCSPIEWNPKIALPNGATMGAPFGEIQGMSLILDSCWEPEVTERLLTTLMPGDVFLDVGANMGYYTLLASRLVGLEGLVVSFEPSPSNLRNLSINLAENKLSNVALVSLALSDCTGIAKLWSAPYYNTGVCSLNTTSAASTSAFDWVATTRLDDLRGIRDLATRARLLKIDTEGAELQVLRGSSEFLQASTRLEIVCELSPSWCSSSDLVTYLAQFGYRGEFFSNGVWQSLEMSRPTVQCNAWFRRRTM
ncbi:FkbM family methyltransferase [Anatilimnocola sp. NA78]|uniref:FkbM family methyltransferase n=1 Tax=Anatilimnocola sp. NA78 TaxID=3415683 RepID=UPI003CE48EC1